MMEYLTSIILIYLSLGLLETNQINISFGDCETSNKNPGVCQFIKNCTILDVIYQKTDPTEEEISLFSNSQCGYLHDQPIVCCPKTGKDLLPTPDRGECGHQSTEVNLRTGVTQVGDSPWLVLLLYQTFGIYLYSGVIINERYVITTASLSPHNLHGVRIGEWDSQSDPDCSEPNDVDIKFCSPTPIDVRMEAYIRHPLFNESDRTVHEYGIALIRLIESIGKYFNDYVQPICLPQPDNPSYWNFNNQQLINVGWGEFYNKTRIFKKLQMASIVYDRPKCQMKWSMKLITEKHLCALTDFGTMSTTYFSTILAVGEVEGRQYFYLAGQLKYYQPLIKENNTVVYTRVSSYLDWIYENIHY